MLEQKFKIGEKVKVTIIGEVREIYIGYDSKNHEDVVRYKIVEGEEGTAIGIKADKVESITPLKFNDFETFLQDKHGEQYVGTDDMMPDDFNQWLEDLSIDDWLKFGDKFRNTNKE